MWRLSEHNPVQCAINWHVVKPRGTQSGRRRGCVLAAMKNLNKIPNCAKWVLGANLGYKLLLYQSRIQKQIPLQRMKMRNYL